MNIKEIAKHMKREFVDDFVDAFKNIDSRPEHIASFPAHLAGCSRTMPLTLNTELKIRVGAAAWNSTAERIVVGKTCQECKGTILFR